MDECKSFVLDEKCENEILPVVIRNSASDNAENEMHIDLLNVQKVVSESLHQNNRIWKVPWFILIMCLLQISIYFIANKYVCQHLLFMPDHTNEYWRYITYMLLHSDILHLTLNICLQCLTGLYLEIEQGHARVSTIYGIGGISGSVAVQCLQPQLSLMGASAGVYALLMSHLPHLFKNFYTLPYRYLRIVAIIILIISDACFTTFHFLSNHNTNPRICLEAHVAGAITGIVLGCLLFSTTKAKKERKTWLACHS